MLCSCNEHGDGGGTVTEDWTRREVPEWIGKTPDSRVPPHVALRVFERANGICHISRRKIRGGEPWEVEHVTALADWTGEGHGNRESNLRPALVDKHRRKTAQEATERADVRRKRSKHYGIKTAKRPFPKRADPWGYRP